MASFSFFNWGHVPCEVLAPFLLEVPVVVKEEVALSLKADQCPQSDCFAGERQRVPVGQQPPNGRAHNHFEVASVGMLADLTKELRQRQRCVAHC